MTMLKNNYFIVGKYTELAFNLYGTLIWSAGEASLQGLFYAWRGRCGFIGVLNKGATFNFS